MFYRVEVWHNNSLLVHTDRDAHDPAQAVRLTYDLIRNKRIIPTYTSVFVMNENGDVWAYQYTNRNGKLLQKSRRGGRMILHPEIVHDIRAGNSTIRGSL